MDVNIKEDLSTLTTINESVFTKLVNKIEWCISDGVEKAIKSGENQVMEMLLSVWEFFQNNILTKPAFFIGFIVLAGYALLGKKWYECLAGFIKVTIVFNSPILIISGFVPLFFDNATFAVFDCVIDIVSERRHPT